MPAHDSLHDFSKSMFRAQGVERELWIQDQDAPWILLIHESPGITPQVADCGRRFVQAGFSVCMPSLLGTPGAPMSATNSFGSLSRACIQREFSVLAAEDTSPITDWLRALANELASRRPKSEESRREKIGVVGLCLTGNFGLAIAIESCVGGAILSQPSLPFPLTPKLARSVHASAQTLSTLRKRAREEELRVLGLRFTHDILCPASRFQTLREQLGDAFESIEIDSSPGNAHKIPRRAHSVISFDYVPDPAHPTAKAFERCVEFLRETLHAD